MIDHELPGAIGGDEGLDPFGRHLGVAQADRGKTLQSVSAPNQENEARIRDIRTVEVEMAEG